MAVAGGVMAAGLSWGTWFEASIYPVFGFSLPYYVLDPVDEYLAIPLLAGLLLSVGLIGHRKTRRALTAPPDPVASL